MTNRLLLVIVVFLFGCTKPLEVRLQQFLLKGNLEVEANNFDQAVYYFREAVKLDSCFVDAWNNLGTIYHLQKRYEEAVMQYDKALQCNNEFVLALMNRGSSYMELKKYELAANDFNTVNKFHPDSIPILFALGLVHTELKDFAQAKKWYTRILEVDPQNMEARVNTGIVEFYMKNFDAARNTLREAIDSNEKANAFNGLSLIEAEAGNYAVAFEWIEKALMEKPKDPFFINNRGYIYLLQNKLELAARDFDQSIAINPENSWAYRNKGMYYFKIGDFASSLRLLKQAEGMDDSMEFLYSFLCQASLKLNEKEMACKYYVMAIERGEKPTFTNPCK